jgi:hypothetical protein
MSTSLFRMFQRRGTKQQWESINPVLSVGEIGFSLNENVIKLGDGLTAWNSLPSVNGNSAYETAKLNGFVGTEAQWLASLVGAAGADGGFESTQVVSEKTGNYTLLSGDAGKLITNTAAVTITVNNVLTAGQQIDFLQTNAAAFTFVAGSGVTLNSKGSQLSTAALGSPASIKCTASGIYWLVGDLG